MEALLDNNRVAMEKEEISCENNNKVCNFEDLDGVGSGESSLSPDEITLNGENCSSADSSSPVSMAWSLHKEDKAPHRVGSDVVEEVDKLQSDNNRKLEKQESSISDFEMMKERFSKLLLGEDMSGSGNGVSTALAISNAITNICSTIFGQVWRLEPLQHEKKLMWRREMDWLLCVSNYIVELVPSWQNSPDGSKLEVMTSRPRSDLYTNLPALRKLDHMILEVLDSFADSEFWYVDQGIVVPESDESSSLRIPLPRQEDKWWLPVPRIPTGGLSGDARKMLQHRRDCTNQILKAAIAINNAALAEMDVPDSFVEALPKNAKASLGDLIHRYITSDQFSAEVLLNFLDLSSDHHALEIANRVEAAIYVWRRKTSSKPIVHGTQRSNSKSSWEIVKEFVFDADKIEQLADKAESLFLYLKHKFPGLPQTTLDTSKIQHNKDVGKSILESYSRVLESLAFNIVARIDDLLYVDDLSKHSDQLMSFSKISMIHPKCHGLNSIPLSSGNLIGKELKPAYVEDQENFLCKRNYMYDLSDYGKPKAVSSSSSTTSFDFRSSSMTREIAASPSFESCSRSGEALSTRRNSFMLD